MAQRIAGWLSMALGLSLTLIGTHLSSVAIPPDWAPSRNRVCLWSGGLIVAGGGVVALGIWVLRQDPL